MERIAAAASPPVQKASALMPHWRVDAMINRSIAIALATTFLLGLAAARSFLDDYLAVP